RAAAACRPPRPDRVLVRVLPGLGGGQDGGNGRALPARGARPLRLPPRLLLARTGARPAQPRAGLDGEVRVGPEGLAQDRPRLPLSAGRARPAVRLASTLVVVSLFVFAVLVSARPAAAAESAASGERGTVFMSARPGRIVVADEATFSRTAEIPLATARGG